MPSEPKDLFDTVRRGIGEGIASLLKDPRTPEAKLLAGRDRRSRNWKNHSRAYFMVNGGLALMNVLIAVTTGVTFPWAAFPALFWGMGFGIHGLAYRGWLKDNAKAIEAAEVKLGLLPAPKSRKALAPPKNAPVIDGVAIREPRWIELLQELDDAVERAMDALEGVDQQAASTVELQVHLEEGLKNAGQLGAGAERIAIAIEELGQEPQAMQAELDALDQKINEASDPQLKEVFLANRALLLARKAKVEALGGERERMLASAEGFLLAAQNVRLDIAQLGADDAPKPKALNEPAQRLNQEVEVLRKVEAELRQIG